MDIIIGIIQSILIVSLEITYCFIFIGIFVDKRILRYKYARYGILAVTVLCVTLSSSFIPILLIKALFNVFIIAAFMLLLFKCNYLKSLFLAMIFFGICTGVDSMTVIVIEYLLPAETVQYLENPIFGSIVVLLSRTLLFAAVIFIQKRWDRNNSLNYISGSEWVRFLYFPIMSTVVLCSMLVNFSGDIGVKASNTLLIIAFVLVLTNLMVFYLMKDIIQRERLIQEDKIFKERMVNQTSMYHSMSDNFQLQRKRIHEYNNQIECIEGMLIKNNVKEALQYVESITGGLKKEVDSIDTNNVIINTIINMKYQEAQQKNIIMIVKVNDLSMCSISDQDIVIILSNLLNNAIEACEKLKNRRMMWLKFVIEEDMTVISVKNKAEDNVQITDDTIFITSKENKEEHGFGIRNIKECVEKYKGSYKIQLKEGYFFFGIIIPKRR